MKIATIIGARPQFIKAAVVSRALRMRGGVCEILIHTGQHFDANMSDVFFDELDIPLPDYHLAIGGGTHGQNTGRMIEAIEESLIKEKPDWALVYGDTDSTMAGALVAVKLHIPVAHVEAGLRSFNRRMPEEINRVLTDHVADYLFAPTETAVRNLLAEGISKSHIQLVGDVMYDAVLHYGEKAERQSRILERFEAESKSYVLATLHRAENVDDPIRLGSILEGFGNSNKRIIWPMHPRTRKRIAEFGFNIPHNVCSTDPVGYLDMMMLEKNAVVIATDSGGVQKEAYFHRVPCVTIREETEWLELVEMGVNRVVGTGIDQIAEALSVWPSPLLDWGRCPYGDGRSSGRIVDALLAGIPL